jgi:hypothetical protein
MELCILYKEYSKINKMCFSLCLSIFKEYKQHLFDNLTISSVIVGTSWVWFPVRKYSVRCKTGKVLYLL